MKGKLGDLLATAEPIPGAVGEGEALEAVLSEYMRSPPWGDRGRALESALRELQGSMRARHPALAVVFTAIHASHEQGAGADELMLRKNIGAACSDDVRSALERVLRGSASRYAVDALLPDLLKSAQKAAARGALDAARARVDAGEDPASVLASLELRSEAGGSALKVEAEAAQDLLGELNLLAQNGREFQGLRSGYSWLDKALGGLPVGLVLLSGCPGTGKTTLAKQIADNVAELECVPVLYFAYEQGAQELRVKSLARLASVPLEQVTRGPRTDDVGAWTKLENAHARYIKCIGPHQTLVDAGPAWDPAALRAAARTARRRAGAAQFLIVVDYLQLVPGGSAGPDTTRERVDYVLGELRRIARDMRCTVLVIASANREAYKGNARPTLFAMKESGGIEYAADAALFLWPNSDNARTDNGERIAAHILKNRSGGLTTLPLVFHAKYAKYEQDNEAAPAGLSRAEALGG